MSIDPVILFLHIAAVIGAFCASAITHFSLVRLRAARDLGDARAAARTLKRVGPMMPLFALGLFVTGAALVRHQWTWSTPWVDVAIIGLVVMVVIGGAFLKPRLGKVAQVLAQGDGGPMEPHQVAAARNRAIWVVAHAPAAIASAIVFNMVTKPGLGTSIATVAVAVILGTGIAMTSGS